VKLRSATFGTSSIVCGIAVICGVAFVSTARPALAGINVWTTHGPYMGHVLALAIDPDTPSTLYAGTTYGGVFKSTNSQGAGLPS
jgi:hypothetical protein